MINNNYLLKYNNQFFGEMIMEIGNDLKKKARMIIGG